MNTDRELLTLAAKAGGIEVDWLYTDLHQPASLPHGYFVIRNSSGGHSFWNSLADDGDTFRLQVTLRIKSRYNEALGQGLAWDSMQRESQANVEDCGRDECAAARRAVTLAAAEIGKAMP